MMFNSNNMKVKFENLPSEIFLFNLLPKLPVQSLSNLFHVTNRRIKALAREELATRRKRSWRPRGLKRKRSNTTDSVEVPPRNNKPISSSVRLIESILDEEQAIVSESLGNSFDWWLSNVAPKLCHFCEKRVAKPFPFNNAIRCCSTCSLQEGNEGNSNSKCNDNIKCRLITQGNAIKKYGLTREDLAILNRLERVAVNWEARQSVNHIIREMDLFNSNSTANGNHHFYTDKFAFRTPAYSSSYELVAPPPAILVPGTLMNTRINHKSSSSSTSCQFFYPLQFTAASQHPSSQSTSYHHSLLNYQTNGSPIFYWEWEVASLAQKIYPLQDKSDDNDDVDEQENVDRSNAPQRKGAYTRARKARYARAMRLFYDQVQKTLVHKFENLLSSYNSNYTNNNTNNNIENSAAFFNSNINNNSNFNNFNNSNLNYHQFYQSSCNNLFLQDHRIVPYNPTHPNQNQTQTPIPYSSLQGCPMTLYSNCRHHPTIDYKSIVFYNLNLAMIYLFPVYAPKFWGPPEGSGPINCDKTVEQVANIIFEIMIQHT